MGAPPPPPGQFVGGDVELPGLAHKPAAKGGKKTRKKKRGGKAKGKKRR